jgi:large subunit ribosomal protein L10
VNLNQKKQIADALHEKFARSKVVILTDYKGLDVASMNALRRKLKEADIEYKVVKNSLLVRASEGTDAALISDFFEGPSAVALSYDDPVAPAKILSEFAEDNKKLELKIGVMNGRALDLAAIKALSNLPSREVLLGKLLSAMSGVPTGLVRTLNGVPQKFLNLLMALRDQKQAT